MNAIARKSEVFSSLEQPFERSRATWHRTEAQEEAMERSHQVFWSCVIDSLPSSAFHNKRVLDFGCNRGGFLKLLDERFRPESGVGVDLAYGSLQVAKGRLDKKRFSFELTDCLSSLEEEFDVGVSLEVTYLLPNLRDHAQLIHQVMKTGADYYIALGCHTGNPLWDEWRDGIHQSTGWPVYSYSPEDVAAAFQREGFSVAVQQVICNHFIPVPKIREDAQWLPTVSKVLSYYYGTLLIFRMTKEGVS